MEVTRLERITDGPNHHAFPDIIRFRDRLFLTYRECPDGHGIFHTSQIVVLASDDGRDWREVHRVGIPGHRDARDPHFAVINDQLFIYSGTWLVGPGREGLKDWPNISSYALWSRDGLSWSPPHPIEGSRGYYFWRTASHNGRHYICAKDYRAMPGRRHAMMFASDDGLTWREAACFLPEIGDETAFRFDASGAVTAIVRATGYNGRICRAQPPYTEWRRTELPFAIGGPMLVQIGGDLVVGARLIKQGVPPQTVLWKLEGETLIELLRLPSGGDNSYPSFLELEPRRGLLAYYSSHEEGTHIYVAEVSY